MTILSGRERLNDDLYDLKLRIAKTNARRNAQINQLRRNIAGGSFRHKLYPRPKDFYRCLYFNDPSLYPLAYPWRSSSLDSLLLDRYYEDDPRKSAVLDHDYDFVDKYDRPIESSADLLSKLKDFVVEQEREITNDLLRKIADRRYAQERLVLKSNIPPAKSRDRSPPLKRDPSILAPINKKDNFCKRYNAFVKKILRPLRKPTPAKSLENVSNVPGASTPYRSAYSRSYLDYDPFYRPRWYWYASPLYRRHLHDYDYLPKLQPASVPRDVESIIQSKCDNRHKAVNDSSFFPAPASYKYDPFESDSYLRSSLPTWKQYYYTQKLKSKPSNERYLDYYDPYYDFFPDEASVNSTEELSNEDGNVDDADKLVDEYRDAIYEDIIRNLRHKQSKGKAKMAPRLALDRKLFGYRIDESKEAQPYDGPYRGAGKWKNEATVTAVDGGCPPTPANFATLPKNDVGLIEKHDTTFTRAKHSPSKDYQNLKIGDEERAPRTEYYSKYNEKSDSTPEYNYKPDRTTNKGYVTRENLCRSYAEENASKPCFDKYEARNVLSKHAEDPPVQKFGNQLLKQVSYKPTIAEDNSYTTKYTAGGVHHPNNRSKPAEKDENDSVFEYSPAVARKGEREAHPAHAAEEPRARRYSGQRYASENENFPSTYPTTTESESVQPSATKNETTRKPRSLVFENPSTTYQNYLADGLPTRHVQHESENLTTYSPKYVTEFPRHTSQPYSAPKSEDESFQKYVSDESAAPSRQTRPSVTENENLSRGYSPETSGHASPRRFSTSKNDHPYRPEMSPTKVRPPMSKNDSSRYLGESAQNADQRRSSTYENRTFQEYPENVSPPRRIRSSIPEDEGVLASKYPPEITKLPTDDISFQKHPPAVHPSENRRASALYSSPSKEMVIKSAHLPEDTPPPPRSPPKMTQKMRPSVSEIESKDLAYETSQSPTRRRMSISKLENAPRSPTKETRQPNRVQEDDGAHTYRTESSTKGKLLRSVALENETKVNDMPPDGFSTAWNDEAQHATPPTNFEDTTVHSRRATALQSGPPSRSTNAAERVPLSRRSSTVSALQGPLDAPQTVPPRKGSIKPSLSRKNSAQVLNPAVTRSPEKIPAPSVDSFSIEEVNEPVEASSYPASNTDIPRPNYQTESMHKPQESAVAYDENSPYVRDSNEIYDLNQSVPGYPSGGYYDQYPHPYEENSKDVRSRDTYENPPANRMTQQFYDQRYSMPGHGDSTNYDTNYNYFPTNEGYSGGYGYEGANYHQPPTNSAYLPPEYADYAYPQNAEPYEDKFEENADPRNISAYAPEYADDTSEYHRSSLPRNSNDPARPEAEERNFVTPYDQYTVDQKEPDRSLNSIDENSNSMSLNESGSKKQEQDSADDVTREISIEDSSAADSNPPSKSIDPPKSAAAKETPALTRRSSKNALSSQSSEEKKSKVQPQTSDLQKRISKTKLSDSKLRRMPSSVKNKPVIKKT